MFWGLGSPFLKESPTAGHSPALEAPGGPAGSLCAYRVGSTQPRLTGPRTQQGRSPARQVTGLDLPHHLEEGREDHGTRVAKLEGCEQLRQHLVPAEVLGEGAQALTQFLEELLLLGWLLDLQEQRWSSHRWPPV